MSDEIGPEPPATPASPLWKRLLKQVARALLLVVLILVAGFVVTSFVASRGLDRRVQALRAGVIASREAPGDRPALLGAVSHGDAVLDYFAIDLALEPGQGVAALSSGLAVAAPALAPGEAGTFDATELQRTLTAHLAGRQGLDHEQERQVVALFPLARHLRDGVRRPRCAWPFPLERGASAPLPAFRSYRVVALAMAVQAERSGDPAVMARAGLELVLFGRDVARHPTVLGALVGAAIGRAGLETLERALTRGLPRPALDEVLRVLGALPPFQLDDAARGERLRHEATLSALCGRPADPARPPDPGDAALATDARMLLGPIVLEREWARLVALHERSLAIATLPTRERATHARVLRAELDAAGQLLAITPFYPAARDQLDDVNARLGLVRLLAAAHVHHDETGELPTSAETLRSHLGGPVPADPFLPSAPLRLRRGGERLLIAWSAGLDGTDEGGKAGASAREGDLVATTELR